MSAPAGAQALASVSQACQTLLAFDYGVKRVGVASGNSLTRQAQALQTISAQGRRQFDHIAKLLQDWQPQALVVGVPFHPDGAEHDNTLRARRFAASLRGRFHLPVYEVDERYSTVEALADGARDADASAAAILLQQHFDAERRPPLGSS